MVELLEEAGLPPLCIAVAEETDAERDTQRKGTMWGAVMQRSDFHTEHLAQWAKHTHGLQNTPQAPILVILRAQHMLLHTALYKLFQQNAQWATAFEGECSRLKPANVTTTAINAITERVCTKPTLQKGDNSYAQSSKGCLGSFDC